MRLRWLLIFALVVAAALVAPSALSGLRGLGVTPEGYAAGVLSDEGLAAVYAAGPQEAPVQQKEKNKEKHKEHKGWGGSDDSEYTEKDEVRQSFQLAPGALVKVSGINGSIDVETSSGSTAEVHVVRSARTREDLNFRKVIIEQTAGGLVVRGESDRERSRDGEYGRRSDVRQRVSLKIPRQVEFAASGINGRALVGEIDGSVKLSGINGRVEVGQALGYTEMSGINGSVLVTVARVGEQGIRVSGVNGGVEMRFADEVNADLSVTGVNGSVNADLPNVTMVGRVSRSSFNAKIGSGGAPINVSGVNGRVQLARKS
ncbi:MAG: hypothetical protein ACRD9R_21275 [Pyrinomonadaceae bacterium]